MDPFVDNHYLVFPCGTSVPLAALKEPLAIDIHPVQVVDPVNESRELRCRITIRSVTGTYNVTPSTTYSPGTLATDSVHAAVARIRKIFNDYLTNMKAET